MSKGTMFWGLPTITFVVLKLCHVIKLSWLWVLSPTIIIILFVLQPFLLLLYFVMISVTNSKKKIKGSK
jgi:hypothetical protein